MPLFRNLSSVFGILINQFRSLEVNGIEGASQPSEHFGLSAHRWSEVERFANGLPWNFPLGQLSAQDVNDAKGDRTSLVAQLDYWREYRKTQEQNLETFGEIQKERLDLGKSVLGARYADAQNDAKMAEAVYKHAAQMGVLQQRNLNAQELAQLQMDLGIRLENHKHQNNRDYEQAQFGEQTGLETTRLNTRKTSLVDRYRSMREQAQNPSQKEETFVPTPGRVLRFGRRAS